MESEIYSPEEDSYLMEDNIKKAIIKILKKNSNAKFLEIGCGSGINLQAALSAGIKKQNIFSCDINPKAVRHCKNLDFNSIESDLFTKIAPQKFDIIIFNPPYLPEDNQEPKDSKIATTAGKKGNEIILKFLEEAKPYLGKDGKIFVITSSLSEEIDFKKMSYKSKLVNIKKLFFEELFLWELKSLV